MVRSKIPIIPTNFSFYVDPRNPPRTPKNIPNFLFFSVAIGKPKAVKAVRCNQLTHPFVESLSRSLPTAASGHALHQGDLAQRRLDNRWRHRDHSGRQLLRWPAGCVRHHAGLERANYLACDPGADPAKAHPRRGGGDAIL